MEGVEGTNRGEACLAPLKKEGMIVVLVSLLVTQGFGEVGGGSGV